MKPAHGFRAQYLLHTLTCVFLFYDCFCRTQKGIVVTFDAKKQPGVRYADTEKYQVYSYVETNDPPSTSTWNKVGEVGSLRLPMACTFTQFKDGHRIFFAVRGVDATGRLGSFNEPKAIDLRENVIIL